MRSDCQVCKFESVCGQDFAPDEGVCPGELGLRSTPIVRVSRATVKRGIYETTYGNTAYVSGPSAKSAYDLDMAERIPLEMVTTKWIREAESGDVH